MSWLLERLAAVVAPWTTLPDTRSDLRRHEYELNALRSLIVTTADNLAARLDAATNEIATDLQSVKDALAAAIAGQDAAVVAAVSAELAKLEAPIARLESLGQDPADPVPAPVDPEPVPADDPVPPPA